MRAFFFLCFCLAAAQIPLPVELSSFNGLGDLSNTAFGQNVPVTPGVTTNTLDGEALAGKRDGVYAGTGLVNGDFSVSTGDGVTIGLRARARYSAATAPALFSSGVLELTPTQAMALDYSVNVDGIAHANLGALTAGGGRFEFGMDIDPSDNVDFVVYDPVSFDQRGGGPLNARPGIFQVDQAYVSTAPPSPAGIVSGGDGDPDNFPAARNLAAGLQNSFQPWFAARVDMSSNPVNRIATFLGAAGISDPAATGTVMSGPLAGTDINTLPIVFPQGRYEMYFAYIDSAGVEQARSTFSVFQDQSSLNGALNPVTLFGLFVAE